LIYHPQVVLSVVLLLFFCFYGVYHATLVVKTWICSKLPEKKNKYSDAFPIDSPNGGLNNAVLKKKNADSANPGNAWLLGFFMTRTPCLQINSRNSS
jgi:predicted RND superfamily exporter protein